MSKRISPWMGVIPLAVLMALVWASGVGAAPTSPEAARLDTFTEPDGTRLFALCVNATVPVPAPEACDVVVLLDTSASQTGDFRAAALSSLRTLLAELKPEDRVKLIAVDLDAIDMCDKLVAPGSEEMKAALAKLDARVPVGATDMARALRAAASSFDGEARPRAVVYIGDGMSAADLVGTQEFAKLVKLLVDSRIAVSSFAVGPRLDAQLLGTLAGKTGGVLVEQTEDLTAEQAGAALASAARGVVYWPTAVTLPKDRLVEVYPKQFPPLRADRDSAVVGVLKGEGPIEIQMTAQTPEGAKEMTWSVAPQPSSKLHGYLVTLLDHARDDAGMSLPLIGSTSLDQARDVVLASGINYAELARQAMESGDAGAARKMAEEALRRKPGDRRAAAVLAKLEEAPGSEPAGLKRAGAAPGEPAEPADGALAEAYRHNRDLIAAQLTKDVQVAIADARKEMAVSPESVIQGLKLKLEMVRGVDELDPDVRDQLVGQIEAALRLANQRQEVAENRRQQEAEVRAQAEERKITVQNLARKEEKVKQLMERFDSLLREDRYRKENYVQAEEQIMPTAQEIVGEAGMTSSEPTMAAATLYARTRRYYFESQQLRVLRQRKVVEALASAELAHVCFDDNEPIVYPDAEVWNRMSKLRKERYRAADLAVRSDADKRIKSALQEDTVLDFDETPLEQVMSYLEDLHKIPIRIRQRALEGLGLTIDTPVTFHVRGMQLHRVLNQMLGDLELNYIIEDGFLIITSREDAEESMARRVYPVADLVVPIINMPGGMMGMGGMGMGGMGMMNLPPQAMPEGLFRRLPPAAQELLPKRAGPGGFFLFSVRDDRKPTPKAAPEKPRPEKIEVSLQEGADPQQVWDAYFAAHEPVESAVREAMRRLMDDKQYDHAIALCSAALRHGQAQPWMYEAMGLAMQIDGRPTEEIERVIMSAVDMAQSPEDLLYVAAYLADIGSDARALQVFRQASTIAPERPEPYMHGLSVAQRANNLDGIKWATLGILSRAWPGEQSDVWTKGYRAAEATLAELKKQNRTKEAAEYEAALDEAVGRDVVAFVEWTGEADVDLVVEEPAGTVCSSRHPRTTSGGIMLGDKFPAFDEQGAVGYKEGYVCPLGFAGQYKLAIRRVYGEVTAGTVTVHVLVNWNSKAAQRIQKRIRLKDDAAMVVFELPKGRRTESLAAHQIANAAAGQVAVQREILAQQLAGGAVDPMSALNLSRARQGNNNNNNGLLPWNQGGVGYEPRLTTLTEGAMLGYPMPLTAVVSADRRYVRVTPNPMFSQIGEVNTFNFVTGEGGQQGGQGGMGGMGGMGGGGFGGGGGMGGMGGGVL